MSEIKIRVVLFNSQILKTQDLLQHIDRQNRDEMWLILARFINEHVAINNACLIPDWLDEYVRYTNPTALPQAF